MIVAETNDRTSREWKLLWPWKVRRNFCAACEGRLKKQAQKRRAYARGTSRGYFRAENRSERDASDARDTCQFASGISPSCNMGNYLRDAGAAGAVSAWIPSARTNWGSMRMALLGALAPLRRALEWWTRSRHGACAAGRGVRTAISQCGGPRGGFRQECAGLAGGGGAGFRSRRDRHGHGARAAGKSEAADVSLSGSKRR